MNPVKFVTSFERTSIMILTCLRMIRPVLATAVVLAVPAFAVCSLLLGGTSAGATVELGADDPIRAGFRVTAPREPAVQHLAVAHQGDADEEVVPVVWVFSSKGNPSPWQGGGTATTTSLSGPASASKGKSVTFTATVQGTNSYGPPALTVTFYDGSTSLGSVSLTGGSNLKSTASLAVTFTTTGKHNISAKYNGDFNDSPSSSNTVICTVS
jgi:Bacterial Ig-like domain (group 3)